MMRAPKRTTDYLVGRYQQFLHEACFRDQGADRQSRSVIRRTNLRVAVAAPDFARPKRRRQSSSPQSFRERTRRSRRRPGSARLLFLNPKLDLGVGIDYPAPRSIGADRLANAAAVAQLYGYPAIVVDFGTAVTFDVVSAARRLCRRSHRAGPGGHDEFSLSTDRVAAEVDPARTGAGDRQNHARRDDVRRGFRISRPGPRDPACASAAKIFRGANRELSRPAGMRN